MAAGSTSEICVVIGWSTNECPDGVQVMSKRRTSRMTCRREFPSWLADVVPRIQTSQTAGGPLEAERSYDLSDTGSWPGRVGTPDAFVGGSCDICVQRYEGGSPRSTTTGSMRATSCGQRRCGNPPMSWHCYVVVFTKRFDDLHRITRDSRESRWSALAPGTQGSSVTSRHARRRARDPERESRIQSRPEQA